MALNMKYSTPASIETVCNNGAAAPIANALRLNDLRLEVHLGWTDEERARPQPVEATVFIRFPKILSACKTDNLADTACYAHICEAIEAAVREKPFKLIERLAFELHAATIACLPEGARACVELTKIEAPVKNLLGGATFIYGDAWGDKL